MTPCAALTEFEQEPLEMIDEALFEVPLPPDVRLADEVEQVRVSGGLLGEVGITRGEGVREVADRVSRSVVTSGGDVLSRTSRLHPFSIAWTAYQSRSSGSDSFSIRAI